MNIICLSLSPDGNYVAYCLFNRRVTVKSINYSLPDQISTRTVFAETNSVRHSRIRQFLFDSKSERLLVCCVENLQVLRVTDGSIASERVISLTEKPAQWGNHPTDPNLLLAFTASQVCAFSWDTLEAKHTLSQKVSGDGSDSEPGPSLSLKALIPSYHPKMHLAIISENTEKGKALRFLLLDTAVLCEDSTDPPSSDTINAAQLPLQIAECIEQPVGLLADGRLVFSDKGLWVCTAQLRLPSAGRLETSETVVTRHFLHPS